MAIGLKKTRRFLDPETCFRMWMRLGSIQKVVNELVRDGVVNPFTGKSPTTMGVWNSAWLYALENMVEGRQAANEAWKLNGEILTDAIWLKLVASKAKYLYNKKRYEKFLRDHSYLQPYV